jgi:rare lipoprotein A
MPKRLSCNDLLARLMRRMNTLRMPLPMATRASFALAVLLAAAPVALAEDHLCERRILGDCVIVDDHCPELDAPQPEVFDLDELSGRLRKYAEVEEKHRLSGLASYYSGFFDGRKTANGEIFRNGKFSAAHLTLPLGTWIEVKARATGRKLRMRVNDRGPYVKKFMLDLSQAAARFLGVDVARDRYVDVRVIALPGEEPLPEDFEEAPEETAVAAATQPGS